MKKTLIITLFSLLLISCEKETEETIDPNKETIEMTVTVFNEKSHECTFWVNGVVKNKLFVEKEHTEKYTRVIGQKDEIVIKVDAKKPSYRITIKKPNYTINGLKKETNSEYKRKI